MRNFVNGSRVLSLLAVTGLFLLFQNMTPTELDAKVALKPTEVLHESNARGLLSMYYGDGAKREVQNSKFLNFLILEQLEKSLPRELQSRALEISQTLISDSREWEFDPLLILAMAQTESQFDVKKRGPNGERGLLQILPESAARIAEKYHFKLKSKGDGSLEDPKMNMQIGIRYLDSIRSLNGPRQAPLQKEHAVAVMKNYIALSQQIAKAQRKLDADEIASARSHQ